MQPQLVVHATKFVRAEMASLESIAGLADQKQKVEQYRSLLASLVAASDVEGLKGLTDHSALRIVFLSFLLHFNKALHLGQE